MGMLCLPYLGFFGNDAILQFQLAYDCFRYPPQLSLSVPNAAGGFYLRAQFGLTEGDADGDGRRQGPLVDDQFDRGQPAALCCIFPVTYADQGLPVAHCQALGAGCSR